MRPGEVFAWKHKNLKWNPGLDYQIGKMGMGYGIGVKSLPWGRTAIQKTNGLVIKNLDNGSSIEEKVYAVALKEAQKTATELTERWGVKYVLINATTKGNRAVARRLSKRVIVKRKTG